MKSWSCGKTSSSPSAGLPLGLMLGPPLSCSAADLRPAQHHPVCILYRPGQLAVYPGDHDGLCLPGQQHPGSQVQVYQHGRGAQERRIEGVNICAFQSRYSLLPGMYSSPGLFFALLRAGAEHIRGGRFFTGGVITAPLFPSAYLPRWAGRRVTSPGSRATGQRRAAWPLISSCPCLRPGGRRGGRHAGALRRYGGGVMAQYGALCYINRDNIWHIEALITSRPPIRRKPAMSRSARH